MSDTDPTARYLTCPGGHVYSAREPACPTCAKGSAPIERSGGQGSSADAVAASIAAAAASLLVEARMAGKPLTREGAIEAAVELYHAAAARLAGAHVAPTIPAPAQADPVYMTSLVASRPEDLLGRVLAGRYVVEMVLGRGGQAVVYRAADTAGGGKVALKVLLLPGRDDLWRDFQQEAKAARRVSHPAVARVLDEVESDGLRYLVFEYVEGETLRAILKRMGTLPMELAVGIVWRAAEGVAAAHKAAVFHTDIKPENLIVTRSNPVPLVKVLDLGLAIVDRMDADGTETRVGAVAGTPLYMAPEQAQGLVLDARCDVYGLALVLYECLSGANPYGPADSTGKIFARKFQGPPAPLAKSLGFVPPQLDQLLAASLHPDRTKRPADAVAFARLLSSVPIATETDFMRT